ncbi:MAG: hypothetical protein FD165_303 [Gammaproteobacteria bacterium]|nr:MAG: hypothetical protein FD165_303 [Gammaproteobacteria bacterium]TND06882.1 MAG: hypothetical protein FD120_614 [Gammaproteobacteria bacterium]
METKNIAIRAIDRIKQAEGLRYDADVADRLNVERKRLSQWKYRGTPPYEKLIDYSRKSGISLDWLLNDRGPMRTNDLVAEPGAIYRVTTDQDVVYKLAAEVFQAVVESGINLSPEHFRNIVRLLHRDMLNHRETSIPYDKVLETVKAIATV